MTTKLITPKNIQYTLIFLTVCGYLWLRFSHPTPPTPPEETVTAITNHARQLETVIDQYLGLIATDSATAYTTLFTNNARESFTLDQLQAYQTQYPILNQPDNHFTLEAVSPIGEDNIYSITGHLNQPENKILFDLLADNDTYLINYFKVFAATPSATLNP